MTTVTDPTPTDAPARPDAAEACLDRATDALLALQDGAGWWKGELETNVTMDAEDLLLRQFLGIRTDAETARAATWIRSQQRDDGTWANYYGGPGDLSTALGCPGQLDTEVYLGALDQVVAAARGAQIAAGILVGDVDAVESHLDRGFSFVAVASDSALLRRAVTTAAMRQR